MPGERRCPSLGGCPMLRAFEASGTAGVWKMNYCEADFSTCQRYQRKQRGEEVPTELMPNGQLLRVRAKK